MMTLIYRGGCIVENLATDNKDYVPDLRETDVAVTLMARDYKGLKNFNSNAIMEIYGVDEIKVEVLGGLGEKTSNGGTQFFNQHRIYDTEQLCPALNACEVIPKICDTVLVKQATKDGYIPCKIGGVVDLNFPDSTTRRGRVIENGQISPTLTTENIPSVLERWIWEINGQKYLIRIRKLTPRECWRLMDFSDEDFDKAQAVNSNSQLYKQAGNSIVKNVLCEVFRELIR